MAAGAARIVYVGHATVLVEMDGVRLLTDPLLRRRLLHLRRVGPVDVESLGEVDAVLISHLHFDHLDLPSLRLLGREVPIIVPPGAAGLLARNGFGSVTELGIGEELRVGAVSVRGTPASHDAGRVPFGARAEPMGHAISGSRAVYFAGDTDLFDGMEALGPVDVALVPIWGWGPSLGAGHMTPREAAEAVRTLRAAVAIPIHWGTYFTLQRALRRTRPVVDSPAEEFSEHARELAPGAEVRVLRPGEETWV